MEEFYRIVKPQAHLYMFLGIRDFLPILNAAEKAGWELLDQLIWAKRTKIMSRYFMKQVEHIYMFCRKKDRRKRCNKPSTSNLLNCPIVQKKCGKTKRHPTEKPLTLLETLITMSSNEGDIILDAFAGSGSTGVASVRNKRNFIGMELNEKYTKEGNKWIEVKLSSKM